jgi:hypothetical protein
MMTLAGCSTDPSLGNGGGSPDSGSAAGGTSTNANSQLQHCSAPMGSVEINEDETAPWYAELATYQLPSTVTLLRLVVQQSNCFVIVDRAQGLANDMNEQALAQSGELRSNANMGKGQIVAADYSMVPSINFNQQTGGGGGALGSFIPGALGGVFAAASAGMHENQASTTLLLVDNRSTVQIAASQGSAKNFDFSGGLGMFGWLSGGGASAYTSTPEGKVVTAAFLDSYNQMVESLRDYKAQEVQGGLGAGGTLKVGQ